MRAIAPVALGAALAAGCGGLTARPGGPAVDDRGGVIEARVTEGPVTYVFRASLLGNLTYQLDCLAELHPCSRDAFAAAWRARGESDDDARAIATWGELLGRERGAIDDGRRLDAAPLLPIPFHRMEVATSLRRAGLGARDVDEYAGRIEVLVPPADAAALRGIVDRFAPRGAAIWRDHRRGLAAAIADYAALARDPAVAALNTAVLRFYATVEPPGSEQVFELIGRPAHRSSTSAEQLGTIAIVESIAGEAPIRRFPVIEHEMFHAWFAAAPVDQLVELATRFAAVPDPLAGPAWGLLDEVLATALANGLLEREIDPVTAARHRAEDRGLYDDPLIDPLAKAMMPVLEGWLGAGKTVFDVDFIATYLATVHATFPDGLPTAAYLRPLACVYDDALPEAAQHLFDLAHANYIDCASRGDAEAVQIVARASRWGTVVMLTFASALGETVDDGLLDAATLATVRTAARARKPFVVTVPRAPFGTLFVAVAADDAGMAALLDRLVAQDRLTPGVLTP